jgi:hypothetical protein
MEIQGHLLLKVAEQWRAGIRHYGKGVHIGTFADEIDAGRKAAELFGAFVRLNVRDEVASHG